MGGKINLTQPSASFQPTATAARLAGWQAGTTECDSREVKNWCHLISSHPPTSLATSWSNTTANTPLCLRCNPPVLVRGKRVRRPTEKHFMHVPRYGIPQTNLLATSHSPRLLGRPQKHVVKPSLASFSHTRYTGPSRSFPALHTSSRRGSSWVCQPSSPVAPSQSGQ